MHGFRNGALKSRTMEISNRTNFIKGIHTCKTLLRHDFAFVSVVAMDHLSFSEKDFF